MPFPLWPPLLLGVLAMGDNRNDQAQRATVPPPPPPPPAPTPSTPSTSTPSTSTPSTPPAPHYPDADPHSARGAVVHGARSTPWVYAQGSLGKLRSRYHNVDLCREVERFGRHYFPGVPLTALLALGVTSMGQWERGGPPDFACGWFGVEWHWWEQVHADAETVRVLGHAGTTDATAWGVAYDQQAFAGLRTFARHADAAMAWWRAHGRPDLGAMDPVWRYRVAASAYSSGPGTVAPEVAAALTRADVGAGPTGATWRQLAAAVDHLCPDCSHRVGPVRCCGRWHACDVVVRCDGRFESGRLLAEAVAPAEVGWYQGAIGSNAGDRAIASRLTDRVNTRG